MMRRGEIGTAIVVLLCGLAIAGAIMNCLEVSRDDETAERARARLERLVAYRDSVEAERSKWEAVDVVVKAMDKAVLNDPPALSCVISLARNGYFVRANHGATVSCSGDSITVDRIGWQLEFTTEPYREVVFFVQRNSEGRRMRVYPIDSLGRIGCADGDTAWSDWADF